MSHPSHKNSELDHLERLTLLAKEALSHYEFGKAIRLYQELLKIYPQDLSALLTLGALYEKEHPLEAETLYTQASLYHPIATQPLLALANLAIQKREYLEAEAWLLSLIAKKIDPFEAILQLAYLYGYYLHKDKSARYWWEYLINYPKEESDRLHQYQIQAYLALAQYYQEHYQEDQATQLLLFAIIKYPDNYQIIMQLVKYLELGGLTRVALELLHQVLEFNPSNGVIYRELGRLYLLLQDNQQAKFYLELAYHFNPNDLITLKNLAYYYQKKALWPKAIKLYKAIVQADFSASFAMQYLSIGYLAIGWREEALYWQAKAIAVQKLFY